MKIITSILFAILLLSFTAPSAFKKTTETLLGFSLNDEKSEVTITVASNGCTAKTDFSFLVKNGTITVQRSKKDECKRLTEAVSFTFSFREAGLETNKLYRILNPFVANPFTANMH